MPVNHRTFKPDIPVTIPRAGLVVLSDPWGVRILPGE
jgi:hypothetical protein